LAELRSIITKRSIESDDRALRDLVSAQPLTGICVAVLGVILVAGLWPFHAPHNNVSWLSAGSGVLFRKHGSIVSAGPFKARASQGDNSCSLEIWLKPSRVDSGGMILAFYWPEGRVVPFALRQFRDVLVLEHGARSRFDKRAEMYVSEVFAIQKPVLVTITSGNAGTATYVDGKLVKNVPSFTISNRDLTGQFVVGNAPTTTYSWSGQLKGLAVYDRELSAAGVSQNFLDWTNGSNLNSAKSEGVVARYFFDEGKGNVIHNQAGSATDLLIPEHFFVLHEQFLEPPWEEFHPGWNYWKNIGINVVGFIPLGFFFYAYFSQLQKFGNPVVLTIVLGFAVSLTIEVLQSFLPTRDSGMTDLITNTFGTAVGVMAIRHRAVQATLAATGFIEIRRST
jgi:VanZ like family/Concanavalin A-like lectin/glucanases superfamily